MTLSETTVRQLQAFEDAEIMPLLHELQAGAIREPDFKLVLVPGSIAFLVNNADAYEVVGDTVCWQPLTVLYCDDSDHKGEVFRFTAARDCNGVRLVMAEISGCCRCVTYGNVVEMRNPIDDRRLLTFRNPDPSGLILNSWYVFRGAILPMLYYRTYQFVHSAPDRVRFQAQMMHQIRVAYQGVT